MKLESYSAILAVSNLEASLSFYTEKLGFTLESSYGNPPYVASIRRDQAQSISLLCMKGAIVGNNSIATLAFRCQEIDAILKKALEIGEKKTKEDTVVEALKEFIVRREQQKIPGLFGTVDYFEDYEPKIFRSK